MTEQQATGMDAFTRRYIAVLAAAVLVGLLWWLLGGDSRVSELNDDLADDATIAAYPYPFQVLSVENGVAKVSSPRSAQMSAIQGLRILFPELVNASAISPEMMAAQEQLAAVQSRVGTVVGEHPDVARVQWVLDETWLARHGVYVQ